MHYILKFLLAVLGMCAYPFDYDYPAPVSDLHNQTVRITFDIKDNPVISQEISSFISPLYVLRCLPYFPRNLVAPRIQLPANVGVTTFKIFEQGQVQNAHLEKRKYSHFGSVNNSSHNGNCQQLQQASALAYLGLWMQNDLQEIYSKVVINNFTCRKLLKSRSNYRVTPSTKTQFRLNRQPCADAAKQVALYAPCLG